MITSEKDKKIIKKMLRLMVLSRKKIDEMDNSLRVVIEILTGGYIEGPDIGSNNLDDLAQSVWWDMLRYIQILITGEYNKGLTNKVYEVTDEEELSVDEIVDIVYNELTK